MVGDRARWDAKYAADPGRAGAAPDPFYRDAIELVPGPAGGRALDLAAGTGRHALDLAARGWRATAWDVSPVGLGILRERAAARGLTVRTRAVDLLAADADALAAHGPFDLVVAVDFLLRDRVPLVARLVAPGGHLVHATFTADHPGERPPPRYRLRARELERGLEGFETLVAREEGGRAGLLARRSEPTER